MGELEVVSGFWLQISPAKDTVAIWRVNQWLRDNLGGANTQPWEEMIYVGSAPVK